MTFHARFGHIHRPFLSLHLFISKYMPTPSLRCHRKVTYIRLFISHGTLAWHVFHHHVKYFNNGNYDTRFEQQQQQLFQITSTSLVPSHRTDTSGCITSNRQLISTLYFKTPSDLFLVPLIEPTTTFCLKFLNNKPLFWFHPLNRQPLYA